METNSNTNNGNKLQFRTRDFLETNPTRQFAIVEDRNLIKKVSYYNAAINDINTKDTEKVEVSSKLIDSLREFFEALYAAI